MGEKWSTNWVITETISPKLSTFVCMCVLVAQSYSTLCDPMECFLSMKFSRGEYWSRLPFPSPGDPPNLGVEPRSPALQAILYPMSHQGSPN